MKLPHVCKFGRAKRYCPLGQNLAALLLAIVLSFSTIIPAEAQEKIKIPYDWALKPSGLGVGDEFRLLVVTRSTRNAESNAISTYNTFVQQDIDHAFSHELIRPYADKFKAVVSTASTNARTNTATLGTEGCNYILSCTPAFIPIYWLLGDKVADDYGDFYDGTWDSETPRTSKGTLASTTPFGSTNLPCHLYWTGSNDSGQAAAGGLGSGTHDRLGYLSSNHPIACGGGGNRNPLSSRDTRNNQNFRFYALSPVFEVARTVSLLSGVQDNSYNEDWKGPSQLNYSLGIPFNIVTKPALKYQENVKVKVRIRDEHATDLVNEETRTVTSYVQTNKQFFSPKTDPLRSIDGSVSMEIIEAPSDVLVTDGRLVYTVKNTIGPPTITISAHATVLAGVNEGRPIQFSLNTDADDGFAGGQDVNVRVTSDPPSLIDPSDRIRSFRASGDSASQTFTLQPLVDPGNEDGNVTIEVLTGDGYDIGTASKIEIPVKNEPVYSGRLLEAVGGTVLEGRDLPFTLSWPKEFQVRGSITPSVKVSVAPTGSEGCKATASADDFMFQTKTIDFLTTAAATVGPNISETFKVSTTNDNFHERDETVCLKIHEPRYLVLPGNKKEIYVGGTIRDNDPLPTISVSSPRASESADELTFEITLDKPPHEKDLTVAYSDSGRGTAAPGKDHDAITAGTLTFSRLPIDDEGTRDTRKTVVVSLINDKEQEGDETVVLRLNKVKNGRFGNGGRNLYATGTIADDERSLPTLEIHHGSDASVQEGGKARIRVDLRDSDGKLTTLGKDIEFTWSVNAFTATTSDFTAVNNASATLPAGETSVEIEVQTLDDSIDEEVEYFYVRINGVADNMKDEVQFSSIPELVPIYDGPTLAILDAGKRTEGKPLEFQVTLGVAAPVDVEIGWKTQTRTGQTATAGKDYTAASGTLTIPAGKTSGLVRVQTLDDTLDEPDEDLSVVLTAPYPPGVDRDYNYGARVELATGVIRDNDPPPHITMTDVSANEGGMMTFKIVLDKVSGKPVKLGWATAPSGSHGATFGKDYRGKQSGQITIEPGGKEARIEFTTVDDTLDEPDETFMVRLYDRDAVPNINPDFAFASQQLSTQTQNAVPLLDATGTIVDNDGTTLSIHDAKPVNERGGATARFRVTLSHAQKADVNVTVNSADGNNPIPAGTIRTTNAVASRGLLKGDYEPILARTLTFKPGETVKIVDVTINDDLVDQPVIEHTETFRMLLSDPKGAAISRGTAIGTIQDSGGIRYSIVNQKRLVREGESITVRVRRDRADAASGEIRICLQSTGTGTGHAVIDEGGGIPVGGEDVYLTRRNTEGSLCTVRTESHQVKYLKFEKGEFETSFLVHTISDALDEGDETFLVTQNSPFLNLTGTDTHLFPKKFTIVDTDFGVLRVEAVNSPYEGQQAEFEVYVDDPAMIAAGGTNIHFNTGDGTATAGDDYEAQNRKTVSLSRPTSADEPAATFTVNTVDNEEFEEDETFSVTLGGLPASLRLHPVLGTATATIRDEDGNRVHLENAVVDEGDRAAIKMRMELPVERTVTVTWKTVAGTAVPVDDFTAVPAGRVRIAPGSTTATIHVATIEDTVREEDESFSVVITGTDYVEALVGRPGNVVIRNDDAGLNVSGFVDASVDEGVSWTSAKPSFEGLAEGDVLWTVEGDDAAEFSIDRDTGQLTLAAKNFEKPADKDKDNIYDAVVRVTDEDGNTGSQAVSVAVNDVVLGYIYVNLDKIRTKQGTHPKVTVDQTSGRIQAEEGAYLNANFFYGDRGLGPGPQFTYKPKPADAPEFGGVECKVSGLGSEGAASTDDISGISCYFSSRWDTGFSRFAQINGRIVQDNVVEGTETFSIDLSTSHEDLLVALWTGSRHVLSSKLVIDITDNPGITLSKDAFTITEGSGSDTYTITLDSQPSHEVTVTVTAPAGTKVNKAGGTAGTSQALTFSPTAAATLWSKPQTITATADQNTDDNPSGRTADITHAAASTDPAYNAIAIDGLEVTITDDDATTVTLATPDTTATEGDDDEKATITLTLGRGLVKGETLAVPLAFTGGTIGTHFTIACPASLPKGITCQNLATAPRVTFTGPDAGTTATAVTLTLTAPHDPGSAGETITVSIPAASTGNAPVLEATGLEGGATGSRTGNGQIAISDDDDGSKGVTVTPTSLNLQEIDDPSTTETTENVGTYAIKLDSQPTANVVINMTVPSGAPFSINPTSLTFTPSGTGIWNTEQVVTVTATDDNIDNASDQRQATITHTLIPGSSNYTGVTVDNVTVIVTDDDEPASFSIADASAAEGEVITFTVNRSGATGEPASISWSTSDDGDGDHPASTGDYTPQTTAQTLSFAAGDTSKTITVQTTQDQIDEENETFLVTLSQPSAGTSISDGTAIGTITDNDDSPTGITLTVDADTETDNVQNSLTENDDGRTVRVTATVKGGSTFPEDQVITIEIGQSADSATEGADYATIADKAITIPAGTTSAHVDFTLTPEDDNLDESDETITISGTTTGDISITGTTITLNDDDTKGVTVTPTNLILLETDDASTTESTENVGTYAIRLDTQPTGNVVINMTVPDGAPFSINPTSLTFTPSGTGIWSTEQTVTVTATNDDIDNTGNQRQATITHTIADGSADYSGASVANVSISVHDDDIPMVSYTLVSPEVIESDAVYPIIITIEPPSATDFMVEFQLSGTAQEGSDHKMEQEVMIPAGESPVETQIEILDDDIIEDDETVIMALMTSPSYEYEPNNPINTALQTMTIIDDDSQSGNPDPIAAWQTRFGRAVAEHALEGISNRIEAPRYAQTLIELAGYPLDLNPTGATSTLESTPTGNENINLGDSASGSFGPGNNQAEQNTMTLQEAFLRSSFMTTGYNDSTQESHAYWGQVSQSFFQGSEGELSFDGETTTAMLGADRTKGKWLVGLAVLQSTGKGTYLLADEPGNIEASLTAIVPYTSLAASERFRIWSALGYGNGWIAHSSEPGLTQKADLSWSLAAIGFRGGLLRAAEAGDLELAVVGDAFWTAIKSEKTNDFGGASGEVTKFRFGVEGTKEIALKDNRYLTPRFNISLRRDGGDAETGWGMEVSGGVIWQDTASGLAVDLSGWKLVTHASNGFSDWGYSFSVTYDPNPHSKRGWAASYGQTVNGQPNDIFNTLQQTDQFGSEENGAISRQAEVSYGFPAFDGQYTSSPYIAVNESGYARDLTLGGRLTREHGSPDLDIGVMGKRRESSGSVPDYSVGVDLITRW